MSTENPCFLYLLLHLCMEIGQCSSFKIIAYFWLEYIPFIGASICSFAYMNCWQVAMKLSPNRDKFMEVINGTGDINADIEKFCTTFSPFLKENHEFLVCCLHQFRIQLFCHFRALWNSSRPCYSCRRALVLMIWRLRRAISKVVLQQNKRVLSNSSVAEDIPVFCSHLPIENYTGW